MVAGLREGEHSRQWELLDQGPLEEVFKCSRN